MKIDSNRPPSLPGPARSARGRSGDAGGGFATQLESGSGSGAAVAAPVPLAALDAVLAAQEVADERPGRSRAIARGHDLLDRLQELRLVLLGDAPAGSALDRLAALVGGSRPEVDDPALSRTLGEIELRAAVELAKRGRAPG
jgi:hypothetical protein